jgi:opacity protein-like surface antigen
MKAIIVASAVALLPAMAAAQAPSPSKVDWKRMAELVVARWQLQRGERAVLFWERTADRGAAAALRTAISGRGGIVSGEIDTADPRDDAAWAKAFANADVAIWLPGNARFDDRPFERLVEGNPRVRSIHFHWFLPPDAALHDRIDAMYAVAIAVPPEVLRTRQAALEKKLRGAKVRITTADGTDLTLEVPKEARFHRNTGEASAAKVKDANSVRDREEELPGGVLRTTDLRGASGTLVGYGMFATSGPILAATFKEGRVTALESRRAADEIVKRWNAATGDKSLPAELVISTNPALDAVLPGGFMPYYGYGAGIVRVAIGDNWESGGTNRTPMGEILFFMDKATVVADGQTLVREGKLVE